MIECRACGELVGDTWRHAKECKVPTRPEGPSILELLQSLSPDEAAAMRTILTAMSRREELETNGPHELPPTKTL